MLKCHSYESGIIVKNIQNSSSGIMRVIINIQKECEPLVAVGCSESFRFRKDGRCKHNQTTHLDVVIWSRPQEINSI